MQQPFYNTDAKLTALSPLRGTAVLKDMPRRAIVFVDGSNWYHKLKNLLRVKISSGRNNIKPPVNFDLRGFAENLVAPDIIVEIRYYIGKVKRTRGDQKSEKMYSAQQRLVGCLQQQDVIIGFGHLISYPDGSFHEKGVDILLAVEMMRLASQRKYDIAYLVSSDTDLVPAVEECKSLGREIVYVGSSVHGQSFGLTKICNRTILLQPKDVLPFVPQKLF